MSVRWFFIFWALIKIGSTLPSVLEIVHITSSGIKVGCTTLNGVVQELFIVAHNEKMILDPTKLGKRLQSFLPLECLTRNKGSDKKKQFPSLEALGLTRCRSGPPGINGVKGPPGIQGPPGKPGPDGTDGLNGLDGLDGLPGARGRNGVKGRTGPKGPQGPRGTAGMHGLRGVPGRDGRDQLHNINQAPSFQQPLTGLSTTGSSNSPDDTIPNFGQCDRFDLQPVKKDQNVLSTVNIFICNAGDVDVNVQVNSTLNNMQGSYKLVPINVGRSKTQPVKVVV